MSLPHSKDIRAALTAHNVGRDASLLAQKYAKMRQSPFVFLRGACELFYDALAAEPSSVKAPLAWSCGDLHFENFGSYKADNRLVYFDINDYDEAALAPCTWDLLRLLTSILCGAQVLKISATQASAAAQACANAYRQALLHGKPLWVERDTATGMVQELLANLDARKRADFLDKRCTRKGAARQLRLDGVKALAVEPTQRQAVTDFVQDFAHQQANPEFFRVLDVARRIAGTGSLGLARYVILIEGKGSPDGNYLLDLKQAKPSALAPALKRLGLQQPVWTDEAQRVSTAQRLLQAVDHAFLFPVRFQNQSFVLRGLQPSEDRVTLSDWGKKLDRLMETVSIMGRVLAWDQLRAAGRLGSASADALMALAQADDAMTPMLELAAQMDRVTQAQWQAFLATDL